MNRLLKLGSSCGLIALLAFNLQAAPPSWWAARGVIVSGATPADYAVANQGQVKFIAKQAFLEFESRLNGGAGPELTALVASWAQPAAPGVTRQDYAAINQGQLKSIAKKFYDRLAAVGYNQAPLSTGQIYPWTASTADDASYAAANIGQVKYLFSFELTGWSPPTPPTTPSSFLAPSTSSSSVNLFWSAASDASGIQGYKIYRDGVLIATLSGQATYFTDAGVVASTSHTYVVQAFNAAGIHSGYSAGLPATTAASNVPGLEVFTPLP